MNNKVNINTAGKEALEGIKGIGSELAEAIIAYRSTFGAFSNASDLKKVSGISQVFIDNIKSQISWGAVSSMKNKPSVSTVRQNELDKDFVERGYTRFVDNDGSFITFAEYVKKFGNPYRKKGAK